MCFPNGNSTDGKPVYLECAARAFVFDYSKRLLKEVGLQENTRFFIIAASTPVKAGFSRSLDGVKVFSEGRYYDLKSVKVCRLIDGRIACYSCAAF